jgi:hypothetical protein
MINHGTPGMPLFFRLTATSTSPDAWHCIIGKINRLSIVLSFV